MKTILLILALCLTSTAAKADLWKWEQPKAWEIAPLLVAHALIWADVMQTVDWQRKGMPGFETNFALGQQPSRARLILVGGVLPTVLLTAVWYILPTGVRLIPVSGVIGAETMVVYVNAQNGLTIHF